MTLALTLPSSDELKHRWTKFQFTTDRRIGFYRDIKNAINAGIPPYTAVSRMADVSRPRKSLRWLVEILDPVMMDMNAGSSGLSHALSAWIPAEDAAMLLAGETAGDLASAIENLIELLESKRKISSSLKSNLLPSGLLLCGILAVLVYIMSNLVPVLESIISDEVMDKLNMLPYYVTFGNFVLGWGAYIGGAIVIIGVLIFATIPIWRPDQTRMYLDSKIPPWSLIARIQTVFFLISVSSMMTAGRTFKQSVESMQGLASPWLRDYLSQMLLRLRTGSTSEINAMQVALLPTDVSDKLNFYAILPNFTTVMQQTARDAMNQLTAVVARIGALVRFGVMIVTLCFVAFTILSIYEIAPALQSANSAM